MPVLDWIDLFLEYTEGLPSPEIFRRWIAIATLGGAVERRVYAKTSNSNLYPNLFVFLVAPPGVGKDVARFAKMLWRGAQSGLHIAPDDLTKASFIDALSRATREDKSPLANGGDEPHRYHYLNVLASELGVFIPGHDTNFMSVLSKLYDPNDVYTEERRGRKVAEGESKELVIDYPLLNLVGCVQPGYLSSLLPEAAWQQGFTSRIVMVYTATPVKTSLFKSRSMPKETLVKLCGYLKAVASLRGSFKWSDDAAEAIEAWHMADCPPKPEHSRLQNYIPRRIVHTIKLAMISSLSRGTDLIITLEDFERAQDWLLDAERRMPDIFRDMLQHPDSKVLEELQLWALSENVRTNKPIPKARVLSFLSDRAPSEKCERILELAVNSNRLHKMAGFDEYIPASQEEPVA